MAQANTPRTNRTSYDDREGNTSILAYTGNWFHDGTYNASRTGETGTLSSSNDPNASLRFNFPTPAVAFYYYGMLRSRGGLYGICVDCDPNDPHFVDIDGVDPTDDGKNPPSLLYSQRFDKPGSHVIIVRNQNDTRFPNGNSQLAFDRIELEMETPNTLPPASSGGPSSTPRPVSTTNPTSSSASSSGGTQPTPVNIGAIAGGVVAGIVALLGIIIVAFLLLRRRHRRKATPSLDLGEPDDGQYGHTPVWSSRSGTGSGPTHTSMFSTSSSPPVSWKQPPSDAQLPANTNYPSKERHILTLSNPSIPNSSSRTDYFGTSAASSDEVRREVDAGPLSRTATLPPAYGEWRQNR